VSERRGVTVGLTDQGKITVFSDDVDGSRQRSQKIVQYQGVELLEPLLHR